MTTIFGRIDCLSSQSLTTSTLLDGSRCAMEIYINAFQFLQYLQAQGVTTLVSYFAGSSSIVGFNPGGPGAGTEHWDFVGNSTGAIRPTGSWSVWRFNPYEDRNWSWYLYLHCAAGGGGQWALPSANSAPTKIWWDANAGTASIGYTFSNGIGMQAAISLSGTQTENPWNGTISLTGTGAKASPPWTSSAGYDLYVFPRVNNLTGAAVTEKDVIIPFVYQEMLGPKNSFVARYNFWSDGHGLLFNYMAAWVGQPFPNTYPITNYIGPYKLFEPVRRYNTGSLLGSTSSYGMCMFTSMYPWTTPSTTQNSSGIVTTTIPYYTDIDFPTTSPTITNQGGHNSGFALGGIFVTNKHQIRRFRLVNNSGLSGYSLGITNSFTGKLDELPIYLIMNEGPRYAGPAGMLNPLLIRSINNVLTHDISADGNRAIFGASATQLQQKLSLPWTGSNPPGTYPTREGITFKTDNYIY